MTANGAPNLRQRGAISLAWVVILSALVAAAAMAALFSMRYERNLFAEAWDKMAGAVPAATLAPAGPLLRKCLINGKTVVSNVDCKDDNRTSKTIEIHDSHGFAPLAPKPAPQKDEPTSNPAVDKMIEKQLR